MFSDLVKFLGADKSITLVDNPWADGVEPMVKEFKRHLLAQTLPALRHVSQSVADILLTASTN